jgi:acetamidase/formamidase
LALVVAGRLTRTIKPDGSAQSDIHKTSSVDLALRDSFRKMRYVLITAKKLTDDEAISLTTVAIDFGVIQVVDENRGVRAVIRKDFFSGTEACVFTNVGSRIR